MARMYGKMKKRGAGKKSRKAKRKVKSSRGITGRRYARK